MSNLQTPPVAMTSDAELLETLRLTLVSGVGPRIRQSLLERFGTAAAVFQAGRNDLLAVDGVGPKLAGEIAAARTNGHVEAELELCRRHHIDLLPQASPDYPKLLREIHDPPGVLFLRGRIEPRDGMAVAVVGARHGSRYGIAQAERLAGDLARAGYTVISGLARGIDAAAHRGALAAGGRTLAVLGSGLLRLYPPENKDLATQIVERGAVISELSPRVAPRPETFPQRNRIVTGLSLGVLVVEANERSGALISARHALEQGREVFAVPGPIDSRTSRGCHRLIRDGAKLVESVDDILEELGPLAERLQEASAPSPAEIRRPAELLLDEQQWQVLAAIDRQATSIDAVVRASGLPTHRVLATISMLEMSRLVERISGSQVARRE